MKPLHYIVMALLIVSLGASGCIANSRASLGKTGLTYSNSSLGIGYKNDVSQQFVNSHWRVVNWVKSPDSSVFHRRVGPAYKGKIETDLNEDGYFESSTDYYLDLELRHSVSDSSIKVFTTDIPMSLGKTDMTVLLQKRLESMSGAFTWFSGSLGCGDVARSRVYVTNIVESRKFSCNGRDAVIASVEVANRDQLIQNPQHLSKKLTVLLMRIEKFSPTKIIHQEGRSFYYRMFELPTILSIVLASSPDHYEKDNEDLYSLLSHLQLDGSACKDIPAFSPGVFKPQSLPPELVPVPIKAAVHETNGDSPVLEGPITENEPFTNKEESTLPDGEDGAPIATEDPGVAESE